MLLHVYLGTGCSAVLSKCYSSIWVTCTCEELCVYFKTNTLFEQKYILHGPAFRGLQTDFFMLGVVIDITELSSLVPV